MSAKIRVRRLMIVIVIMSLLGSAFYWYARSAPDRNAPVTFAVQRSDLTVKISELGELRALDSVTILAQKDGPIAFLVPEGTGVSRGDVLVRFDPSQYEVALGASKVELLLAQAELQKAVKDLEAQRQRLLADQARLDGEVRLADLELAELKRKPLADERERAQLELEKAKVAFDNADEKRKVLPELVEKGFITRSTLEEAQVNYLAAKVILQAAHFAFERVTAGATPEELKKATIRLAQAKSALDRADSGMKPQLQALEAAVERQKANVGRAKNLIEKAQAELAKTSLHAPQAGLVVYAKAGGSGSTEKVHLGMMAFAGQPLLYLPDISTMVADTEVNEVDIARIRQGGPVEVKLEAYPGTLFHGRVFEIGALARLKRNRSGTDSKVKVFDVTVRIEEKEPRLKPGLTATVDIIVDRQRDVVSVPISAVVSRRGEYVVFVASAGQIEERKVVLGPSNDQRVVVTEGLRPGERVILGPPPSEPR